MHAPSPHELPPPIDARSPRAQAAGRGAGVGFWCAMVVTIPLMFVVRELPQGGSLKAIFAGVVVGSLVVVGAALVSMWRTRAKRIRAIRQASIDARPLIASGAVRGAVGGFCWSLLVGVPLALMIWAMPLGGPLWAAFTVGLTSLIWTAIAAFAGAGRTREKTYTDEQRAVLHRRTRRSAIQGACFALPVGAFALITNWAHGAGGAIMTAAWIVGFWVGCAALVGHLLGKRAVRAMQREAREKMDRADAAMIPREGGAAPSEDMKPDVTRLAEARIRIEVGHED